MGDMGRFAAGTGCRAKKMVMSSRAFYIPPPFLHLKSLSFPTALAFGENTTLTPPIATAADASRRVKSAVLSQSESSFCLAPHKSDDLIIGN